MAKGHHLDSFNFPDRDDDPGRAGFQGPGQGRQRLHYGKGTAEAEQQAEPHRGRCHHEKGKLLF